MRCEIQEGVRPYIRAGVAVILLPMMAIRGQGSYLRDVLEVQAIHRISPGPACPSIHHNACCRLFSKTSGKRSTSRDCPFCLGAAFGRVPFGLVEGRASGQYRPSGTSDLVGQRHNHHVVVPALE